MVFQNKNDLIDWMIIYKKINKYCKIYNNRHMYIIPKEKRQEYSKRFYQKNKEKINKRKRELYQVNKNIDNLRRLRNYYHKKEFLRLSNILLE